MMDDKGGNDRNMGASDLIRYMIDELRGVVMLEPETEKVLIKLAHECERELEALVCEMGDSGKPISPFMLTGMAIKNGLMRLSDEELDGFSALILGLFEAISDFAVLPCFFGEEFKEEFLLAMTSLANFWAKAVLMEAARRMGVSFEGMQ